MSEYAKAEDNKNLIGKHARIKKDLPDYCAYLWLHTGIIQEVYGNLFLSFDIPAKRTEFDQMDGVYLTPTCFELIEVE